MNKNMIKSKNRDKWAHDNKQKQRQTKAQPRATIENNKDENTTMNNNKDNAPSNSLTNSIANPKVKTMEGERVGICFLVYSTSGVEGVLELQDGD